MLNTNEICALLYFGYIPQVKEDWTDAVWAKKTKRPANLSLSDRKESELIAQGVDALKPAFREVPEATHVVPISGGLDSRAVLAGLLDAGLREHINGVTYGVPGNLDYEIGNLVAKACGIRYVSIDLNNIELDTQSLVEAVAREEHWGWIFDFYYNRLIPETFGKDAVYWSGFMGDALSGRHLWGVNKPTWEEALARFVQDNSIGKRLSCSKSDLTTFLPHHFPIENSTLGFDDQLDFVVRQESYIRNTVIVPGYDYRTPFLSAPWVEFILNVPRAYRYKQRLYRKILLKAFPELFSLPTINNLGLSLNATEFRLIQRRVARKFSNIIYRIKKTVGGRLVTSSSPSVKYTNYIDFDESIRERKDLRALVDENIADLAKRDIIDWIDIENLWERHQKRLCNYGYSISLLVSVEIILKSHDCS